MFVVISHLPLRLAVGQLLSVMVNNHGKSRGGGGLHFISPHLQQGDEPQRKLQTSRPLSCAEEWAVPRQVAKLLNEHHYPVCVCVCMYAIACWCYHHFFPFVCVLSSRCLGGRVDNVMLTLEERVSSHYCVAGQLKQTGLTNAQCIIQNILHFCITLLHANSIHY